VCAHPWGLAAHPTGVGVLMQEMVDGERVVDPGWRPLFADLDDFVGTRAPHGWRPRVRLRPQSVEEAFGCEAVVLDARGWVHADPVCPDVQGRCVPVDEPGQGRWPCGCVTVDRLGVIPPPDLGSLGFYRKPGGGDYATGPKAIVEAAGRVARARAKAEVEGPPVAVAVWCGRDPLTGWGRRVVVRTAQVLFLLVLVLGLVERGVGAFLAGVVLVWVLVVLVVDGWRRVLRWRETSWQVRQWEHVIPPD